MLIGSWDGDPRWVDKSRMNREVHVRFREDVGVKLPRVTRLFYFKPFRKVRI